MREETAALLMRCYRVSEDTAREFAHGAGPHKFATARGNNARVPTGGELVPPPKVLSAASGERAGGHLRHHLYNGALGASVAPASCDARTRDRAKRQTVKIQKEKEQKWHPYWNFTNNTPLV